ncbi:MAG: hypothetical protein OEL20_05130 [Sulfuritalea sp.]|nr:hypothetical protein [Sulfuritalea sp.]
MLHATDRPESETPHPAWEKLHAVLQVTPLPTESGGSVVCQREDFMLMGVDERGTARFKNIITRNYLYIQPDGALRIPTGGSWAGGFFAHQASDGDVR